MSNDEKRKARAERKALKKKLKEEAKKRKGAFSGFGTASSSSSSSRSSSSSWSNERWWVSDYGKKTVGQSVSSYWTSRVDDSWYGYGWGGYNRAGTTGGTDFDAIITSVRRSANIVTNAEKEGEEERELFVRWATDPKHRNTSKGKDVFLSPSVVDKGYTKKKEWTDDERADVLIGEALVQSTMKHTIESSVEEEMCNGSGTEKGRLENEMWTVSEHIFAEKQVLENYPGFKGYFAANRAYYTGKNSKKNFEAIIEKKVDPISAVTGLMWELLHPSEPLDAPEDMREFLDWSKEQFANETTSRGRADAAKTIVKKAYEVWKTEGDGENPNDPKASLSEMLIPEIGISESGRDEEMELATEDPVNLDGRNDSRKDPHSIPPTLDALDWHGGTVDYKVPADSRGTMQYKETIKRLGPMIRDVKNRLKFRAEEQRHVEHALKRGRLDEGSLYKLGFFAMDYRDDKIFEQEEIISMPKIAFGLLVDESGSMGGGDGAGKYKFESARDCAIVLANALKDIDGLELGVWGHTANSYYQDNKHTSGMAIHHYFTPEHQCMEAMGKMAAFSNNLDGYAIGHVAKHMLRVFPNSSSRILIHISDGYPAGSGYGGTSALQHVGAVSKLCKGKGVKVIGIGIGGAYGNAEGNLMYGPGNFAVIKGVSGMQSMITNLVVRTANARA